MVHAARKAGAKSEASKRKENAAYKEVVAIKNTACYGSYTIQEHFQNCRVENCTQVLGEAIGAVAEGSFAPKC